MNFFLLFKRDVRWYFKPFVALSAAACLICAVLTSAILIGESVRGTLDDNLKKNTSFVKTLIRFSRPVKAGVKNGVLHTPGFVSTGIKTNIYAFPGNPLISGRDAYCSNALANALKLKVGDTFSIRVQTMAEIKSEELMGLPPQLRLIRFIYRGIWQDERADVNFENPQLRPYNLFVNHAFLSKSLELKQGVVNEIWSNEEENLARANITSDVIWKLSQLEFSRWQKRPILKSKSYFLPTKVIKACPRASKGLISFAEALSDSQRKINYFFVGAFERNIFPVKKNSIVVSSTVKERFRSPVSLTCFATDGYRKISRKTHIFRNVSTMDDSRISSALSPDIPGLTTADNCSRWKTGIPIDLKRISKEDEAYWKKYKNKPKIYLHFDQAQQIFAPGQCTLLAFDKDRNILGIKKQIVSALRNDPALFQCIPVARNHEEKYSKWDTVRSTLFGFELFHHHFCSADFMDAVETSFI